MNGFLGRRASTTKTTIQIQAMRFLSSASYKSEPVLSGDKLFVGGLSALVDTPDLVKAFSSFGTVTEAIVVHDKQTGRSRGYGYVRFEDEETAVAAKDAMDGKALLGRPIGIRFALGRARGGPVVPHFSNAKNRSNS